MSEPSEKLPDLTKSWIIVDSERQTVEDVDELVDNGEENKKNGETVLTAAPAENVKESKKPIEDTKETCVDSDSDSISIISEISDTSSSGKSDVEESVAAPACSDKDGDKNEVALTEIRESVDWHFIFETICAIMIVICGCFSVITINNKEPEQDPVYSPSYLSYKERYHHYGYAAAAYCDHLRDQTDMDIDTYKQCLRNYVDRPATKNAHREQAAEQPKKNEISKEQKQISINEPYHSTQNHDNLIAKKTQIGEESQSEDLSKDDENHRNSEALSKDDEKHRNSEALSKDDEKHRNSGDKDENDIKMEELKAKEEYLREKEKFLIKKEHDLVKKELKFNNEKEHCEKSKKHESRHDNKEYKKEKSAKRSNEEFEEGNKKSKDHHKNKPQHKNRSKKKYKREDEEKYKNYLSQEWPKEYEKQRVNHTGQWYINLHKGRSDIRKKEQSSDWVFDRSRFRHFKREDKGYWYFQLMLNRKRLRLH